MTDTPLYPAPMSDRDNARLFNQLIRPTLTGTPRESPTVLFVAGPPGAGKTTVQNTLLQRMQLTEAFPLDGDDLLSFHPRHTAFSQDNDLTASFLASEDIKGRWWTRTARLLRAQRLDIVISAPLAGPDWALARFAEFRKAGYGEIGVAFVATHEAQSLQGIVARYHQGHHDIGYGRWIPPQWHDAAHAGVLDTADRIDARAAADRVYVARRDGTLVHTNQLDHSSTWTLGGATRQAIEAERKRRWTGEESAQFLQTQGRLRIEMSAEWAPLLDSIDRRAIPVIAPLTVHDDAQLAARRLESTRLLRHAERELETAQEHGKHLLDQHRAGGNAARIEELQAAGTPPEEVRQARDRMHQERWGVNITTFDLSRRAAGAKELVDAVTQETQRRTELTPKQRQHEAQARQHVRRLAARQPPQTAPRAEGPRHDGPERRGPRQGL
ncbi:zeta toxin family protein [Streptomyces pristinaespiralis]|uniref:zeta toxin family protein n=1 Tax=Streptomyces pristinaespiralis TaxID=38300 RepID=UPI003833EFB8